ncbi:MAG TPA: uridine phosphorylase [Clostridiales bacterium]|jgi:uridine phosphorylase|nr:uridine phosphorylase [Clostridiales bacterium]HQP70304.1 uridine phosphorylase [Clostridiales bacterium]
MKYHVRLNEDMLKGAVTAILPGDPGRVEKTAKHINTNAVFLASNREYTSYLTQADGINILVCSTGIGGPSLSIAVEELASLGIKNFIRIGTTGAIQPYIKIPSLIVTTGAVRLDGASKHYAPIEYPAVADFDITAALIEGAIKSEIPYYKGITASSDTFYPGQERYDTFSKYVIRDFQGSLAEWQKLNVLNFEMESATLFTIANAFGLKAGCIASVIVNRTTGETPDDKVLAEAEANLASAVKYALSTLTIKE